MLHFDFTVSLSSKENSKHNKGRYESQDVRRTHILEDKKPSHGNQINNPGRLKEERSGAIQRKQLHTENFLCDKVNKVAVITS